MTRERQTERETDRQTEIDAETDRKTERGGGDREHVDDDSHYTNRDK